MKVWWNLVNSRQTNAHCRTKRWCTLVHPPGPRDLPDAGKADSHWNPRVFTDNQRPEGFQSQSKDKNNQQLLNSMLCCTLDQFFLSEPRLISRGGRRDEVFKSCPYLIFLSWREMILLIVGVSVMSRLVPWPLKYKVAFITQIIPASSASSQTSVHYLKESI